MSIPILYLTPDLEPTTQKDPETLIARFGLGVEDRTTNTIQKVGERIGIERDGLTWAKAAEYETLFDKWGGVTPFRWHPLGRRTNKLWICSGVDFEYEHEKCRLTAEFMQVFDPAPPIYFVDLYFEPTSYYRSVESDQIFDEKLLTGQLLYRYFHWKYPAEFFQSQYNWVFAATESSRNEIRVGGVAEYEIPSIAMIYSVKIEVFVTQGNFESMGFVLASSIDGSSALEFAWSPALNQLVFFAKNESFSIGSQFSAYSFGSGGAAPPGAYSFFLTFEVSAPDASGVRSARVLTLGINGPPNKTLFSLLVPSDVSNVSRLLGAKNFIGGSYSEGVSIRKWSLF